MEELEQFRTQLKQVEAAIAADPTNADLLKLVDDLNEMINLQSQLVQKPKSQSRKWNVGDECEAIWADDNKYYKVKIVSMSEDGNSANVQFNYFGNTCMVLTSTLKPIESEDKAAQEKRKLKNQKKKKKLEEKEKEFAKVKTSWQDFQHVKVKSKELVNKIPKKSIFASPDSVTGKVGIGTCNIGGKGMTSFQTRGKWQFETQDEE